MKKTLAAAAVAVALMSQGAAAGERPADAALGALSGALVFGPVGLVAGAVVGYTAGPSISHGLRRGESRQARRSSNYEARASAGEPQPVPQDGGSRDSGPRAAPQAAAPARPPGPRTAASAPPVQPLE
jgi:hypothetical protein